STSVSDHFAYTKRTGVFCSVTTKSTSRRSMSGNTEGPGRDLRCPAESGPTSRDDRPPDSQIAAAFPEQETSRGDSAFVPSSRLEFSARQTVKCGRWHKGVQVPEARSLPFCARLEGPREWRSAKEANPQDRAIA